MTTAERLDQICAAFFSGDTARAGAFAACWTVIASDGEVGPDEQDMLSTVAPEFGLEDDPFDSGLVDALIEMTNRQQLHREPIEWILARAPALAARQAAVQAAVMGALIQGDEIGPQHIALKIADMLGLGPQGVVEAAQALADAGWGIAVIEHQGSVPPFLQESTLPVGGSYWQISLIEQE